MNRLWWFALMTAALLMGCGAPQVPSIAITGAWGRTSPSIPAAGSIYMVIQNTGSGADRLTAVKSTVCGMTEVHETVKMADGSMGMNLVSEPVVIPAGGKIELMSGGMHVMCMMMKTDQFKSGGKIDLVMTFEKSGEKTVAIDIREP